MLAFYTREFRDPFFDERPPKGLFQAVVTVLAGYWRPTVQTRFRVWIFFRLVWAQRLFGFSARFTALKSSHRPVTKPAPEL